MVTGLSDPNVVYLVRTTCYGKVACDNGALVQEVAETDIFVFQCKQIETSNGRRN